MKKKTAAAILLTVALAVTGCGSGGSDATENTTATHEGKNTDSKSTNESSQEVFAMDTYMTVWLTYSHSALLFHFLHRLSKAMHQASLSLL